MSLTTEYREPPVTHIELPDRVLTAHDRCDAKNCGAQGYVAVEFKLTLPVKPSGSRSELIFCGHHFRAMESGLIKSAHRIIDQTGTIR